MQTTTAFYSCSPFGTSKLFKNVAPCLYHGAIFMDKTKKRTEYLKRWRLEHKKEIQEYNKKWNAEHYEWVREYKKTHREECRASRKRSYYKRSTSESRFKDKIKCLYKMTLEDYERLLAKQNNKCLICNKVFTDRPRVDHDHRTGKVRGLLCNKCNVAIGLLQDDVSIVSEALNYLLNSRVS